MVDKRKDEWTAERFSYLRLWPVRAMQQSHHPPKFAAESVVRSTIGDIVFALHSTVDVGCDATFNFVIIAARGT